MPPKKKRKTQDASEESNNQPKIEEVNSTSQQIDAVSNTPQINKDDGKGEMKGEMKETKNLELELLQKLHNDFNTRMEQVDNELKQLRQQLELRQRKVRIEPKKALFEPLVLTTTAPSPSPKQNEHTSSENNLLTTTVESAKSIENTKDIKMEDLQPVNAANEVSNNRKQTNDDESSIHDESKANEDMEEESSEEDFMPFEEDEDECSKHMYKLVSNSIDSFCTELLLNVELGQTLSIKLCCRIRTKESWQWVPRRLPFNMQYTNRYQ